MPDLRVYGVNTGQSSTFYFPFLDPLSSTGSYRTTTPTLDVANDLTLYVDGSGVANTGAALTWLGSGYGKLVLTAAQMEGSIIVAIISDASGSQWVDTSIIAHTGGRGNYANAL